MVRHQRHVAVGALRHDGASRRHADRRRRTAVHQLRLSNRLVRPVYAIRPGATGDITLPRDQRSNDYIVWSHPTLAGSYPSGLVTGDTYYMLLDRGIFIATEARTGQEIYGRQRIATDGGMFSASPWAYNGKIFALNEDGTTYVIQAGRKFEVIGKNPLDEFTLATPAISDGSLFIRTATKLYRIGSRPPR